MTVANANKTSDGEGREAFWSARRKSRAFVGRGNVRLAEVGECRMRFGRWEFLDPSKAVLLRTALQDAGAPFGDLP